MCGAIGPDLGLGGLTILLGLIMLFLLSDVIAISDDATNYLLKIVLVCDNELVLLL